MMPNARISIETAAETVDDYGGRSVTWSAGARARIAAEVQAVSAQEAVDAAGKRTATARYRITIRNRTDFDATARVIWHDRGDRVLAVVELPDPGPRATFRTLIAEEGVAV